MPGFFVIVAPTRDTHRAKTVQHDDNNLWQQFAKWLVYIAMGTLGALANYADKVDKGEKFSLSTLALRWIVAAFAASMAGLYCESKELGFLYTSMVCGVCGYSGVTAIKAFQNMLKNITGGNNPPGDNKP